MLKVWYHRGDESRHNFRFDPAAIRHDIHTHPEFCFEEFRTGKIVAAELHRLGFTVAGITGSNILRPINF